MKKGSRDPGFEGSSPIAGNPESDLNPRTLGPSNPASVGVISDTHGLIRPEALAALHGVEHIVHAGDIGRPEVLTALRAIAPVTAVRGNNDHGEWTRGLETTAALQVGPHWLYVLHDLHELDLDPQAAGFAAVIAGHSHRPLIEERRGILYVNPGSAGPRRFTLPIAVARVRVGADRVRGEIILLKRA
jgi:putative phosphoesterase